MGNNTSIVGRHNAYPFVFTLLVNQNIGTAVPISNDEIARTIAVEITEGQPSTGLIDILTQTALR